jgi:hypothetical protein
MLKAYAASARRMIFFSSLQLLSTKTRGILATVIAGSLWDVVDDEIVGLVGLVVIVRLVELDGGRLWEMHVVAPVVQVCVGGQTLHALPMLQVTPGLSQHTAVEI